MLFGPSDVWFGLAINDGPGMVGGDAIAVEPADGGSISQLVLHGKTRADCPSVDPSVSSLVPGSVSIVAANDSAGSVAVSYSRLLAADPCVGTALATSASGGCPGGVAGQRAVGGGGSFVVSLVYVWGLPGRSSISTHTPATTGAIRVNLATGEVLPRAGPGIGELAALVLVALGGSALLPLALAALLSRAAPSAGPAAAWIRGHRVFATAAALAALPGAAVLASSAAGRLTGLPPSTRASLLLVTGAAASIGVVVAIASAALLCTAATLPYWALTRWLGAASKAIDAAAFPAHVLVHPAAAPTPRGVRPAGAASRQQLGDAILDPCEPPQQPEAVAAAGLPRPSAPPASPRGPRSSAAAPASAPLHQLAAYALLGLHAAAVVAVALGVPILVFLFILALQEGSAVLAAAAVVLVAFVVTGSALARCCVGAGGARAARVTSLQLAAEPVAV